MSPSPKIGILTFHRCINYGSYWQARCLAEGLRRRGAEAVLLDHRSARVARAEWRCALSPLLPASAPAADRPLYAAKVRRFAEAFTRLPLSAPFDLDEPQGAGPCDIVVVGSDEVWNLVHPWYAGYPLFFGDGLEAGRLVSYAASFGSYAADWIDQRWAERLRRFAAIAVRDENSRRLVKGAVGAEAELVLDPCLQFPEICRRADADASDALVVYGHSFPSWFQRSVRRWAGRRGLRIVSLGYRNDWAHEQRLDAGPDAFAAAMGAAQAVATNFFHGCVFSLVNGKPFVCAPSDYRANKVTALAASLGAADRLVDAASDEDAYERALAGPADVGARLAAFRVRSEDYLRHAVG